MKRFCKMVSILALLTCMLSFGAMFAAQPVASGSYLEAEIPSFAGFQPVPQNDAAWTKMENARQLWNAREYWDEYRNSRYQMDKLIAVYDVWQIDNNGNRVESWKSTGRRTFFYRSPLLKDGDSLQVIHSLEGENYEVVSYYASDGWACFSLNFPMPNSTIGIFYTHDANKKNVFARNENYFFNRYKDYNDITCTNMNTGVEVTNDFKCDGTYTYYFQADCTAMRHRLTYHPDGQHIIYFNDD